MCFKFCKSLYNVFCFASISVRGKISFTGGLIVRFPMYHLHNNQLFTYESDVEVPKCSIVSKNTVMYYYCYCCYYRRCNFLSLTILLQRRIGLILAVQFYLHFFRNVILLYLFRSLLSKSIFKSKMNLYKCRNSNADN